MAAQPFDLTVHHRDNKSGRIIQENHYTLVCDRDKGTYYIRDGQKWAPNGECMGKIEPDAPKVEPVQPATPAKKVIV